MRRFKVGDEFSVDGFKFRVEQGKKAVDDQRLDSYQDGRWFPVSMHLAAFLTDFFFQNEDVLYPRPRFKGGFKFLQYLRDAALHGWERAEAGLRFERSQKQERQREELFGEEVA